MTTLLKFALLTLVIAHTALTEVHEEENELAEAQSIVACGRCK